MRILIFVVLVVLTIACSSLAPFEPASCPPRDQVDNLDFVSYRDVMRGARTGECFRFAGEIRQVVDGGYLVDNWFVDEVDVYLRWESDEVLVEGDTIQAVGMATGSVSFETVLGAELTVPAVHGAQVELQW